MWFSIATFAVLVFSAASNIAVKLDDVFADTASTFEFIGVADVGDAWNISESSDKSDAFDDTVSAFEDIGDPEIDNSSESSNSSVGTNKAQPDLVVRDLNISIGQ